jgi:hypothetical protein
MIASDASCGESMTRLARRIPVVVAGKTSDLWHEAPAAIVPPTGHVSSAP